MKITPTNTDLNDATSTGQSSHINIHDNSIGINYFLVIKTAESETEWKIWGCQRGHISGSPGFPVPDFGFLEKTGYRVIRLVKAIKTPVCLCSSKSRNVQKYNRILCELHQTVQTHALSFCSLSRSLVSPTKYSSYFNENSASDEYEWWQAHNALDRIFAAGLGNRVPYIGDTITQLCDRCVCSSFLWRLHRELGRIPVMFILSFTVTARQTPWDTRWTCGRSFSGKFHNVVKIPHRRPACAKTLISVVN